MADYYGPESGRAQYFKNMGMNPDGSPLGAPAPQASMQAVDATPNSIQGAYQANQQQVQSNYSNPGRYGAPPMSGGMGMQQPMSQPMQSQPMMGADRYAQAPDMEKRGGPPSDIQNTINQTRGQEMSSAVLPQTPQPVRPQVSQQQATNKPSMANQSQYGGAQRSSMPPPSPNPVASMRGQQRGGMRKPQPQMSAGTPQRSSARTSPSGGAM